MPEGRAGHYTVNNINLQRIFVHMVKIEKPSLRWIPISKLEIWEEANVRKINASARLEELAENIRSNGIEHPLLVKEMGGKFRIFAGQRRYLASKLIGMDPLPCRVYQKIGLDDAIMLSLSENAFTRQMSPADKADAVKTLLTRYGSKKAVCKTLGIRPSNLPVYLGYHGLPGEAKEMVDNGSFNMQFAVGVVGRFRRDDAMDILRAVSRTKKRSVDRGLLVAAVGRASGRETLSEIRTGMRREGSAVLSLQLHMDPADLRRLQKMADKKRLGMEGLVSSILQRSIRRA